MATREEELKELAELEELAQLEALAAQEAEAQPSDLNLLEKGLVAASPVLDPLGRVLDVATLGAPIRAGVAKLVEAQTGKEVAPEKKLIRGQAPSFSEIWEAQGIGPGTSLSELIPGAFSPTGEGLPLKKGGMFDVTPRGVLGGVVDIATGSIGGPVKALAKAIPGAAQLSKVTQALPSKYSIMSTLSGVPKEAIETYAQNKKLINALDQGAAEELAQSATQQAREAIMNTRKKAGEALGEAVTQAGDKAVDVVDFKKQLQAAATPPKEALKNKAAQETYADMQGKVGKLLTVEEPILKTVLDPESPIAATKVISTGKTKVTEIPDKLTAQQLFDLKQQLKEMGDLYGGRGGLLSVLAKKDAPLVSKKFEGDLISAVKKIDSKIDEATAGASEEARKRYAELSKAAEQADRYFSTPEKTVQTLANISTPAKASARRIIKTADQAFGTNLEETGKILESAKYFNAPSIEALSSGGTTSTSRTLGGSAVGGYVGSLLGGPSGAATGAAIGTKAASPWMIKNVYLPTSEMLGAIPPMAGQGIAASQKYAPAQMWMKLLEEQKKQGEQK